ncbi:MAG: hypothetical protein ACTSRU_16260, partial [Candidatus Hodarchaeales archaeon]
KKESAAGKVIPVNTEDQLYADFFGLLSTQLSDITTSSLAIINLLKNELTEIQDCRLLKKLEILLDKNVSSLLKPMSIIHKVVKPDMFSVDLVDVIEEFVQYLSIDQQIQFELDISNDSIYIKSNKMIHDLLNTIIDIVHGIFTKDHLKISCKVYSEASSSAVIDINIIGSFKKDINERVQKNSLIEQFLTTEIKILFKLLELLVNAHGGSYTKQFGVDSLVLSIVFPITKDT